MADIDGRWGVDIATPMGVQHFDFNLASDGEVVTGTATDANGTVDVHDGSFDGTELKLKVSLAAPLVLTIAFTLNVDGDLLAGKAQAGPFPQVDATGKRA